MAEGTFQLISVDKDLDVEFTFHYFPSKVKLSDRANWQEQDVTLGTRPLFYANGDPQKISVNDLVLDTTETGTSLKGELDALKLLKSEKESGGPPPILLAIWGDYTVKCVLENLDTEQIWFNEDGECLRALVHLELKEIQPEGESTNVRVPIYNENVQPG